MKKLFLLMILSCFCLTAKAQQNQALSAAATTCAATGTTCLLVSVDPQQGGATFTVTANASANTIQFEASGDSGKSWVALNVLPSNSTTAVTSTTSTGTWQANVAGYTHLRMRMSTLVGGTTTVSIIGSIASARAGGGGGAGGASYIGRNYFLLQNYPGYNGDAQQVVDATFSNGVAGVTFPNSDGPIASDAGKLCWAMSATMQAGPSAPGTLAVVTPKTSATCTAAAVVGTATANGIFQWGHDDTPAYIAAINALYTQPKCGALILPAARTMINQGISYTGTIASDCGIEIQGYGYASTIMLEPGFSFSTVNNVGCTSNGCFFNSTAASS